MNNETNNENGSPPARGNLLRSALFLVAAFDIFLIAQIHSRWNVLSALLGQQTTIIQQIQEAQKQITEARTTSMVAEGLAKDMLTLSSTDPDIQHLVDKYKSMGISIKQPVAGVSTNK